MNTNATESMTGRYDAIMTQLLELNQAHRAKLQGLTLGMEPWMYAEQFCCLSADAGRQTGKTTWILKHAQPADIVIVANLTRKNSLLQREDFKLPQSRMLTVVDVLDSKFDPDKAPIFRNCYIDESKEVFERISQRRLLKWLVDSMDTSEHTFFSLG